MIWLARVLLIGILALASISLLGAAIAFAAPYLAAIIVLWLIGAGLWKMVGNKDFPEKGKGGS